MKRNLDQFDLQAIAEGDSISVARKFLPRIVGKKVGKGRSRRSMQSPYGVSRNWKPVKLK